MENIGTAHLFDYLSSHKDVTQCSLSFFLCWLLNLKNTKNINIHKKQFNTQKRIICFFMSKKEETVPCIMRISHNNANICCWAVVSHIDKLAVNDNRRCQCLTGILYPTVLCGLNQWRTNIEANIQWVLPHFSNSWSHWIRCFTDVIEKESSGEHDCLCSCPLQNIDKHNLIVSIVEPGQKGRFHVKIMKHLQRQWNRWKA